MPVYHTVNSKSEFRGFGVRFLAFARCVCVVTPKEEMNFKLLKRYNTVISTLTERRQD